MDLHLSHPDNHDPDPARTAASFLLVGFVVLVLAAAVAAVLPKSEADGMRLAIQQVCAL